MGPAPQPHFPAVISGPARAAAGELEGHVRPLTMGGAWRFSSLALARVEKLGACSLFVGLGPHLLDCHPAAAHLPTPAPGHLTNLSHSDSQCHLGKLPAAAGAGGRLQRPLGHPDAEIPGPARRPVAAPRPAPPAPGGRRGAASQHCWSARPAQAAPTPVRWLRGHAAKPRACCGELPPPRLCAHAQGSALPGPGILRMPGWLCHGTHLCTCLPRQPAWLAAPHRLVYARRPPC